MGWINNRAYAEKFITLFAENRITPAQWKYIIPMYLTQQALPIVINAKNFADGIQHNIELYDVRIPDDKLAYDMYSEDFLLE
jgi:hypothetical protein